MKLSTPIFAALLSCSMVHGNAATGTPAASTVQPSLIHVQDLKTKLGLKAWFVENHDIPVVSVSIAFRHAGHKMDPKGLTGLCSFLSTLLTEGAGDKDSIAFHEYLNEKNIQLNINQNADYFYISFRTIKENVDVTFQLIKSVLSAPLFDKGAIERVRQQTITELKQRLFSERARLRDNVNKVLYGQHPYGKTSVMILQDLPHITVDAMKMFMKQNFTRDNLIISASGDITPENLSFFLDDTFGFLEQKAPPLTISPTTFPEKGSVHVDELDIPQSLISYSQPGLARNDPDFFAGLVLIRILGDGGFESRLWNEIREKRGLSYGVSTSLTWQNHSEMIMGQTSTKNQTAQQVVDIIRQEWKKIADHGVTEAEINFVKERLIGSYPLGFTSTNQISDVLLSYQQDNLPLDYINNRNEKIRQVTVDQVNQLAKKMIRPDQLTFVIVGKPILTSALTSATPGKQGTVS